MAVDNTTEQPAREVPAFFNRVMMLLLRSPFHGMMSSQIMLLSFHGRKSGTLYTFPVGYIQNGQRITLFTRNLWWKNLRDNAPVTMRVRGREVQGTANVVLEHEIIEETFRDYLRRIPNAARPFGVTKNATGELDPASIQQVVQSLVMVQIQL